MRLEQAIAAQELEAKSPPGWKHTVEHMKDYPEIDNPFALAWYMKNKGDKSHIKAVGGTPDHRRVQAKKKKVKAYESLQADDVPIVQSAAKIETPTQQSIAKAVVPSGGNKSIVKNKGKVTSHSMNWRKGSEVAMNSLQGAKEKKQMKAEPYIVEPAGKVGQLTAGVVTGNMAQTLATIAITNTKE